MYRRLRLIPLIAAAVTLLMWVQAAGAAALLFNRGMPIYNNNLSPPSNLNGTTNSNRSNFSSSNTYSSQPTTYQVTGDDFSIGKTGQKFQINTVRVWMIYGVPSGQYDTNPLTPPTFALTLWVGPAGGTIQPLAAAPVLTRIWYSDGENYQRTADGAWRGVWQLDFPVNLNIAGGQKYQFFLDGMFHNASGVWQSPSLCLAKESLSNNPHQDGADNQYLALTLANGTPTGSPSYVTPFDANVQIFGSVNVAPLELLLSD